MHSYVIMISQLGRLLRRASSEDYLEESDDTIAHPSWSRAVGMYLVVPRCTLIVSHINW